MKKITIVFGALICACLISFAESGTELNKEGQLYTGLNIGYLHTPGWHILETADGYWTEEAEIIIIDRSGVRIGDNWLGQIYFDDGQLYIKNKDTRHKIMNGKNELGFIRAKIIMNDGKIIHFGKITC